MRPLAKVGIVIAGYVLTLLIAWAAVTGYVAATSGPDRQTYAAMFDFGDSLLFLAVLGVAAVPATAAGLFFLRPVPSFWIALSGVALTIAATGLAAMFEYLAQRSMPASSALHGWSELAVLRILIAPFFALVFLVSAVFAPSRSSRVALLIACGSETAAFAGVVILWSHPLGA